MYNIQNAWRLFCLFCNNWFEIFNFNMHFTQMSCMWIKDDLHFNFQWAADWVAHFFYTWK